MKILFNDVQSQYLVIREKIQDKIEEYFLSGAYIDGPYVREFEKSFCDWTKSKFSIGVSNGTDGLKLAIQTLRKPGKNLVIMPANTFIADALAVTHQINQDEYKFDIMLVDCDDYYQIDVEKLEICFSENQNFDNIILIAVHLYGHPCDMKRILELKNKFSFSIIEDASQAHGAEIDGQMVGNWGDISVYSLYPGKNLGAAGDAGVITTNSKEYNDTLVSLRNYGSEKKYYYSKFGWNNRMDGIQGIILNEKLKHLDDWNLERLRVASTYNNLLRDVEDITLPKTSEYCTKNVFHIYCIRVKEREKLQNYLNDFGITTIIHYPVPIESTDIYKVLSSGKNLNTKNWADEILSLPIHPFMTLEQIEFIVEKIKNYYNR